MVGIIGTGLLTDGLSRFAETRIAICNVCCHIPVVDKAYAADGGYQKDRQNNVDQSSSAP